MYILDAKSTDHMTLFTMRVWIFISYNLQSKVQTYGDCT